MEGIYTESDLTIDLRGKVHFRFQDCPGYIALSGQNLKEMDFGWWDATANTLCLLDVKGYSHLTPRQRLPEDLLETLANKATDSLMMLAAIWSGTTKGGELRSCIPDAAHQPCRLKLFFVLKAPKTLMPEMQALKDKLKQRLRGRLALFGKSNVTLIHHELAIKTGLLPLALAGPGGPAASTL